MVTTGRSRMAQCAVAAVLATSVSTVGFDVQPKAAEAASPVLSHVDVGIDVHDVAIDPVTGTVWATVTNDSPAYAGHLVTIDPSTGSVATDHDVGVRPGSIDIADDGSALYVGLDANGDIRKLNLPGLDEAWTYRFDTRINRQNVAGDIEVAPGNPDLVVVSKRTPGLSPSHAGVVAIDGGVALAGTTRDHTGANEIEFVGPTTLAGLNNGSSSRDFYRLQLSATGVSITDEYGGIEAGSALAGAGGLVYTSAGTAIELGSVPSVVAEFPSQPGWRRDVGFGIDAANDRAYFAFDTAIAVHDLTTREITGAWALPNTIADVRLLRPMTADRLAVVDRNQRLHVASVRSPVAPDRPPPPDPSVRSAALGIHVNDVAVDPIRGTVYASIANDSPSHAGTLVTIDPITGEVTGASDVGVRPGQLDIADDGSAIAVGLDANGEIRQLTLPSLDVEWTHRFDTRVGRRNIAEDIEFAPGGSDLVVVSKQTIGLSPRHAGVVAIDGGVRLADATRDHTGANRIEFVGPSQLVGYNNETTGFWFYLLEVDETGVSIVSQHGDVLTGFGRDLRAVDGSVYTSTGTVIDPGPPPQVIDEFPRMAGATGPFAVDAANERAYIQFGDTIEARDLATGELVDSWDAPSSRGRALHPLTADELISVEAGGVAFLVRLGDLPTPPTPPPPPGVDPGDDLGSYGEYTPMTPTRFLDTRDGTGTSGTGGRLGADQTIQVQIAGRHGIPSTGVVAVVVNVTAVTPTERSFLAVYPSDIERPTIATLNMVPGQNRANLATVPVDAAGRVSLYNRFGSVDVVFDVAGYYSGVDGPSGARFRPLTPVRILDTRDGTGGVAVSRVGPSASVSLRVTGRNGVPANGVRAVVANLTVVGPTSNTFAVAYPADIDRPNAANVNARGGANVGNQVIVRVPTSGVVEFFNRAGSVDFVVDLVGYYDDPDDTDAGRFVPLNPFRWVDTREDSPFGGDGKLGPNFLLFAEDEEVEMSAMVLNVTATATEGAGNIRAFPYPGEQPLASTVNYGHGQTVPNHAIVPTGPGVAFQNNRGRAHLVIDVFGLFL